MSNLPGRDSCPPASTAPCPRILTFGGRAGCSRSLLHQPAHDLQDLRLPQQPVQGVHLPAPQGTKGAQLLQGTAQTGTSGTQLGTHPPQPPRGEDPPPTPPPATAPRSPSSPAAGGCSCGGEAPGPYPETRCRCSGGRCWPRSRCTCQRRLPPSRRRWGPCCRAGLCQSSCQPGRDRGQRGKPGPGPSPPTRQRWAEFL